ncbi:helix-turn-helix domain-containing protein [Rhodococcus sp. BE178]|uniref:helix-turn-helix domain-containing protein n=1 Tax=Rhodococcus sp. BE178 TaxID=2817737 RepID=UPI003D1D285B
MGDPRPLGRAGIGVHRIGCEAVGPGEAFRRSDLESPLEKQIWSSIELRHFIALAEVGRTGSFTAAASSLGYTQSAVSQQIKRLETGIGHQLVERSAGSQPVALTPPQVRYSSHTRSRSKRVWQVPKQICRPCPTAPQDSSGLVRKRRFPDTPAHTRRVLELVASHQCDGGRRLGRRLDVTKSGPRGLPPSHV